MYVHDLSLAACGRDSSTVAEGSPTEGARNMDSDIRDGGVFAGSWVGRFGHGRPGQCLLRLIDQGLMADCSWPCMCGGRRGS